MTDLQCAICGKEKLPQAYLPSLQGIAKAEGRKVTIEDLPRHAICPQCTRLAKAEGHKLFSFEGTVALLNQREQEHGKKREEINRFFALRGALQKAGLAQQKKGG